MPRTSGLDGLFFLKERKPAFVKRKKIEDWKKRRQSCLSGLRLFSVYRTEIVFFWIFRISSSETLILLR